MHPETSDRSEVGLHSGTEASGWGWRLGPGWSHHHIPLRLWWATSRDASFPVVLSFLPTFSRIAYEAPMYQLQPQDHGTPFLLPQDHGKACLMPIVQMGHRGLTGECFSSFVSCTRQRRQAHLITWRCSDRRFLGTSGQHFPGRPQPEGGASLPLFSAVPGGPWAAATPSGPQLPRLGGLLDLT